MELSRVWALSGIHRSFKHLYRAFACILIVIVIGTMGYMRFERLTPFDSLYFTIVTLSTVGFGDLSPTTHESRLFTMFFIPLGVSAFLYTFSAISMAVFEGQIVEVFKMEQAKDRIKKMRDHIILCGFGDVGENVAKTLKTAVIIENDEDRFEELISQGFLGIRGDSTKVEVLREAGIERAKALIIALNEDPKTVFTALTAKELNPRVRIYARANRNDSKNKIRLAGADYVVCLPEIGSRELIRGLSEQKDE